MSAMIRMPRKNGQSTVDLLSHHDPRKLMWQSDASQRKQKVRALTCRRRPSVGRTNGDHDPLSTIIANATKMSSELLRGILLSTAVEEYRVSRTAARLPFQPVEDCGLGIEKLRLARHVSRGAFDIVGE